MFRTSCILVLCFLSTAFAAKCSFGQYGADIETIRRNHAAYSAAMMEKQNQQLRSIAKTQQELRQKMVRDYRNRTGDYSSSDAVVYQRLEQQYYAQNPQAFQQKLAEDQYYAREYQKLHEKSVRDTQYHMQARHAARMDAIQTVGALNTQGFNSRMASMDRNQAGFINMINERGNYYNPATGQTHNLSFHHNQIQSSGGKSFYTDNHGGQHAIGSGQRLQPTSDYPNW